jgi:hypothetical protein
MTGPYPLSCVPVDLQLGLVWNVEVKVELETDGLLHRFFGEIFGQVSMTSLAFQQLLKVSLKLSFQVP